MSENPLIAEEKHETTFYTGIGVLESAEECSTALRSGEWIDAGIDVLSVGVDYVNYLDNPAGALLGWGVDWLFEHVEALSKPLDWLAGNPDAITAHAQTWGNIADAVAATRRDYASAVSGDLTSWQGAAADAYRRHATDTGYLFEAMAIAADAIKVAITLSGQVVNAVRDKIREWIAQLVGNLIAWLTEAAATVGVATPVVAQQATVAIAKQATEIAKLLLKLHQTISALLPLLRHLGEIFQILRGALVAEQYPRGSAISRALSGSAAK
jgi:uncharacterized protein YukE